MSLNNIYAPPKLDYKKNEVADGTIYIEYGIQYSTKKD